MTFYKVIADGQPPQRADASALGTIPTNGFRYCEPLRTANAFGWYIYLPMELHFVWDGYEVKCSIDTGESWFTLVDAIQFPYFSDEFDTQASAGAQGYSPPFVTRTNDHDVIQIWTGVFASTRKGYGVTVRAPVNLRGPETYTIIEGVVETDWWFGPLFVNIRLNRPGELIVLRAHRPFIQVQPFSKAINKQATSRPPEVVVGLESLGDTEWKHYEETVVRRMKTRKRLGEYAVESRKRIRTE